MDVFFSKERQRQELALWIVTAGKAQAEGVRERTHVRDRASEDCNAVQVAQDAVIIGSVAQVVRAHP